MRRLLGLLLPIALLVAACGDDDAEGGGDGSTTTVADAGTEAEAEGVDEDDAEDEEASPEAETTETTVATDAPAGDGPGDAGEGEGLGDALLVADLTPEAEVPGPGATGAFGRFEAELVDGVLCVDMEALDLGDVVVAAHIHEGAAGTAGPVLVGIGDPTSEGPSGATWTDVCTEVGDDVIERLAAAPEQHYVNVHTPAFPDGAVRGQLSVASVFDRTLE